MPDKLEYEPGAFNTTQTDQLKARGHHPEMLDRRYGNQQVSRWSKTDNRVEVASDPRGGGLAATLPATTE